MRLPWGCRVCDLAKSTLWVGWPYLWEGIKMESGQ